MKTKVSNFTEFRAYYLSEFELYDGEVYAFGLFGKIYAKATVRWETV